MAEGVGFEPTVPVKAQRFSRPPRSTTPASLLFWYLGHVRKTTEYRILPQAVSFKNGKRFYPTIVVNSPGMVILITPAQLHISMEEFDKAGWFPIITKGDPIIQGDVVRGMQAAGAPS